MNFHAGIAQLVEYKLPKLGVAGSNPVARSKLFFRRPDSLFEVIGLFSVDLLQIVGITLVLDIAFS